MAKGEVKLSNEQQDFIDMALTGRNILVDACIGSGKTTSIQRLCDEIPNTKNVLYLTYNKLLKLDAKSKIKNKNVQVTNYHGYAYGALIKKGIKVGVSDLIQRFNKEKPYIKPVDVLIIDEYQDIELEVAYMLQYIKEKNKNIQIIAVGDMQQKIYDKTTLDIKAFIQDFLDDYVQMNFTLCFRLNEEHAAYLGRIWNKNIKGVNKECKVEHMTYEGVLSFLADQDPKDVLCLGTRTGGVADVLNSLEESYPDRYNKKTVYASIKDEDGYMSPKATSAIFTTYDSSKGLERPICILFDYTESYWQTRISKFNSNYEILRNIFCVAGSRGKQRIIFVDKPDMLSEETLKTKPETNNVPNKPMDVSEMFDFKFKEDVEECYKLLKVKEVEQADKEVIDIKANDELIDLSPCIGIYQEAFFFKNYNIDSQISHYMAAHKDKEFLIKNHNLQNESVDQKILFLTAVDKGQNRYMKQVQAPFVTEEQAQQLRERLSTVFDGNEESQSEMADALVLDKKKDITLGILGMSDVIKDDVVYELKFVTELKHEHFLQCAMYMYLLELKKGRLWNTRDNTIYEISISNRKKFIKTVVKTITKGKYKNYKE